MELVSDGPEAGVLEEDDELEPLQPEAAAMIASADNKTAIFFFIISFSFPLDI